MVCIRSLIPSFLLFFVSSCALNQEPRPVGWDEVSADPTTATRRPTKSANDFHTDAACVAEAERLVAQSPDDGHALMRGCLYREDFVLLSRLRDKRWRGFELQRADWNAVLRSELRRGSANGLDLTLYGIPSPWLKTAPAKPAPGDTFLLHAEMVEVRDVAGKKTSVVYPIIYGTHDELVAYLQPWDLVETDLRTGAKTVIQKNVKVTTEYERTGGVVQMAHVIKQPLLIEFDERPRQKRGDGLLCIVDRVRGRLDPTELDPELSLELADDDADADREPPRPVRQVVHAVTCVSTSR
jgi:hypothetical protein